MAVRRLGWGIGPQPGVYVCDRVLRCAQEQALRALRLALHRRKLVAAIITTWPQNASARTDAEWQALRARLPDGVSAAEIRNRTRQLRSWRDEHGALPADLIEVEAEPAKVAAQIVLAAADRQLATLERTGPRRARLRVRLPLTASPASRRDWAWHVLPLTLPPTVPPQAALCTPLRVKDGRVRVDLPFQTPIVVAPASGHVVACGFDWGVNTLLTGVTGRLAEGRVLSDG